MVGAGILGAYDLRVGIFSEAVKQEHPVTLRTGVSAFAVYHCGARTQNINRPLEVQVMDWRRIGKFLCRTAG